MLFVFHFLIEFIFRTLLLYIFELLIQLPLSALDIIEGFWRVAVVQSHSHNYENCGLGKRLVKRELEKMPKVEKRKEVATRKLCRYTMLDIIRGVKKCGCSRWNGPLKTVNIYMRTGQYMYSTIHKVDFRIYGIPWRTRKEARTNYSNRVINIHTIAKYFQLSKLWFQRTWVQSEYSTNFL